MYKKNVSKKRKTTSTYKKPYKKAEKKTNKWAPKVSTKEYKYMDNILWLQAVVLQHLVVPLSI